MASDIPVSSYNEYLFQLVQVGDNVACKQLFKDMLESNVIPDVETFSMLIGSTLFENNAERALYYLEKMAAYTVAPTGIFFTALQTIFAANNKKNVAKLAGEYAKKNIVSSDELSAFITLAQKAM